jgi:hypothetical protein
MVLAMLDDQSAASSTYQFDTSHAHRPKFYSYRLYSLRLLVLGSADGGGVGSPTQENLQLVWFSMVPEERPCI